MPFASASVRKGFAGVGIEEMNTLEPGLKPDGRARTGDIAIIGNGAHLVIAKHGEDVDFGPGRLKHAHRRGDTPAFSGNRQMLGPDSIDYLLTRAHAIHLAERQNRAARDPDGDHEHAAVLRAV